LSGIIYIYRISDVRMGGTSSRNFRVFRQLCGTDCLENVILVTNRWSDVTLEAGEQREKELKDDPDFWKPVLDKGATTVRHDNTLPNAREILLRLVSKEPKALRIQQQLVDERKSIGDTDAGSELTFALQTQAAKHQKEMEELRAEMTAAMKEQDEMTRNELSEDLRKAEEKLESVQKAAMSLQKELQDEKRNARALFAIQDAAIAKIAADALRDAENHKAEMDKMTLEHQKLWESLAQTQADAQEMLEKADLELKSLKEGYDNERKQIEIKRRDLPSRLGQVEAGATIATTEATLARKETQELKMLEDRYNLQLMEKEKECEDLQRRIELSTSPGANGKSYNL
jgi:chromosome segregation ATPase